MKKIYVYQARDAVGTLKEGKLEASSAQEVAAYLHGKNYYIASIHEKNRFIRKIEYVFSFNSVKAREVVLFCRQLSIMISSGLPLMNAVEVLLRQTNQPELRKVIGAIQEDLKQGRTLTAAMRRHNHVFSDVILSMVEAGETGGALDEVLERLAIHLERERKIREKAKTALIYPFFILGLSFIMLMVLLLFVLPVFIKIFDSMHMALPLPTRMLIEFSFFLQNFFWLVLLGGGSVVFCGIKLIFKYKLAFDQVLLKSPFIGNLVVKTVTARFARTLGTLLQGGIPLLAALEASKKVTGHCFFIKSLSYIEQKVKDGVQFSAILEKQNLFPPMVTQMIVIGEETGKLDVLLGKIADYYENEVEEMALRLNNLLEPVIILILGVFVGGIVLAVLMPLFDSITCNFN